MNSDKYQVCTRCVMDTSDPQIRFDDAGVCNHCIEFDNETKAQWFPNDEGQRRLSEMVSRIKADGANQEYDCIIGLSGGVDSSYLALKIRDYGLRPLVVHVDAGWNSELAVYNIEQVIKYCGYDLHTHVVDWEEMRDLQLAYLKSNVANQDVPQDHIFFATLYHFAVKSGIRYVISGGNIATEGVFPASWHHSAMDAVNLRAIHNRFGTSKLNDYKTINIFQYYIYYPFIYRMKTVRPLNFMKYDKQSALEFLKKEIGYKEYGNKHGESIFTKFFQNYYLPKKFGFDKRRPHYSSLILSNQISREQAMARLLEPLYDPMSLREDMDYISRKLRITLEQLVELVEAPGVGYSTYRNWDRAYGLLKRVQRLAEKLLRKNIKNYA